ncbi:hypothetical protein OBBRIDRAFT_792319 [Obba rivulosa]|uniref:Nucleotidyltransferase family protein n=1 Tax=Obba rivulosa TaxID=1052685 RepID=A0A8E2AVK3_9APHY|nr:hypothetical protein OBBRIDRAFT_792319 [Obba rivulosa]
MSPQIVSVSSSQEDHKCAARALSEQLDKLGCRYAFIGGFAWSLLGSVRPTEDIDVLIETQGTDISVLRESLVELNGHFAKLGFKLYYVQSPSEDVAREELVRRSRNNVLVETLQAGMLGLPVAAEPTIMVGDHSIRILHPCILILTKFKRWSVSHTSTRPKTIRKVASDRNDINFLIQWLAERQIVIQFQLYQGKSKPELLLMVRRFHDKYMESTDLMGSLRSIMPDDWGTMLALPAPEESSDVPPL